MPNTYFIEIENMSVTENPKQDKTIKLNHSKEIISLFVIAC